jgi:hypothetical protein
MDIRPEKPIKAMDIMAAVIRVMGMPLKGSGTSPNSMFSLIPAISDMASVKPIPAAKPKTVLVTRPYPFSADNSAKPSIAQLVVISGRNIPWHNKGDTGNGFGVWDKAFRRGFCIMDNFHTASGSVPDPGPDTGPFQCYAER